MSLMQRLKQSTSAIHSKTENLPLTKTIAKGTVDKKLYLELLRVLCQVHTVAESEFLIRAELLTPFRSSMLRCWAIREDMEYFGAEIDPVPHPFVSHWSEVMGRIAEESPEIWLGALYVFEGSRNGSAYLARSIANAIGLNFDARTGLAYHLQDVDHLRTRWKQFCDDCDLLNWSERANESVVRGAVLTFQMIFEVYSSLLPIGAIASVSNGNSSHNPVC